jgi:hypothetical protein
MDIIKINMKENQGRNIKKIELSNKIIFYSFIGMIILLIVEFFIR